MTDGSDTIPLQQRMRKAIWHRHLDELLAEAVSSVKHWIVANYRRSSTLYVLALLLATVAFLFATPIGSSDTDLWYHLNGGRLLWDFGEFPDTHFYAFLDSGKEWVNYFWGFQALSFQVHRLFGYEGLILLRVLLIGMALVSISALLIRPGDTLTQRVWALVLLVLVVLVLVGRTGEIRPHLVSYSMIPLFLLILERRRGWLPALPLLTAAWINLHGTEWPVGALICGTYFAESAWHRLRGGADHPRADLRVLAWTALCLPAMFLNPFTTQILTAPFNFSPDIYLYIAELKPYPLTALFTVSLGATALSVAGAIAFLNWGNLLAYGFLFIHRRLRFTPMILSLAGLYLLSRGNRFIWEWLLLSLPLWRSAIDALQALPERTGRRGINPTNLMVLAILISPVFSWWAQIEGRHHWPVDRSGLPDGVTRFLGERQVEGRLLVSPNPGGYLAWKLYPDILISGDMQTPPSTPWDHFRWGAAMRSADALERFVTEHRPQLIAVEVGRKSFPKLIERQAQYRPVFFDDLYALYADGTQLPELVARYELEAVNPFNLLDAKLGSVEDRLAELRRVSSWQPDGDRVQHAITRLLFDNGEFEAALPPARHYAATVPENVNSHYLLGNVLENLDRCEEAGPHYRAALELTSGDFRPVLHRHLGSCAYLTRDFTAAYGHFGKGLNPYERVEDIDYLYQYAVSAVAEGRDDQARRLLRQLLYVAPHEDNRTVVRARALLADL